MKKILITTILFIMILHPTFSKKIKIRDVVVYRYKKYIVENNESSQSKNGLTIEIIPLHPGLVKKYPKLFAWDLNKMPYDWSDLKSLYQPDLEDGKRYGYPFRAGINDLSVFYVKITNNTGHILRMRDARIYLLFEGEDPIKPTSYLGNAVLEDVTPQGQSVLKDRVLYPKSFVNNDGSIIDQITRMFYQWDKNKKKGIIHYNFPVGFPSQIILQNKKNYKLINDIKAEILPDFSYTGIMLFDRLIQDGEQISIRMYDFPTKVDDAGNVIEKSNFQFRFIEEEGTMYYNRNLGKWVVGNPPDQVEYYDKKQKKWLYGTPISK